MILPAVRPDHSQALRLLAEVPFLQRVDLVEKAFVCAPVHTLRLRRQLAVGQRWAERLLDWAEQSARQFNCAVRVDMFQSRVAGVTLVDQAIALKADLIIMGLPYRSRFGSYQLGETSNYVLNHANCRVWLVRAQFAPVLETA